jgi:hypothetical protein
MPDAKVFVAMGQHPFPSNLAARVKRQLVPAAGHNPYIGSERTEKRCFSI